MVLNLWSAKILVENHFGKRVNFDYYGIHKNNAYAHFVLNLVIIITIYYTHTIIILYYYASRNSAQTYDYNL